MSTEMKFYLKRKRKASRRRGVLSGLIRPKEMPLPVKVGPMVLNLGRRSEPHIETAPWWRPLKSLWDARPKWVPPWSRRKPWGS